MVGSANSIGSLIRQLRKASGMSQSQLAEKIGLSYQQLQKYENGMSMLTLLRLRQISEALNVPVTVFLGGEGGLKAGDPATGLLNDEAKLIMLYRRLQNEKLKFSFMEMIENVASIPNGKKN